MNTRADPSIVEVCLVDALRFEEHLQRVLYAFEQRVADLLVAEARQVHKVGHVDARHCVLGDRFGSLPNLRVLRESGTRRVLRVRQLSRERRERHSARLRAHLGAGSAAAADGGDGDGQPDAREACGAARLQDRRVEHLWAHRHDGRSARRAKCAFHEPIRDRKKNAHNIWVLAAWRQPLRTQQMSTSGSLVADGR